MNTSINQRLLALEGAILELAKRAEEQRKLNELKQEIREAIVGLPYYWGEYSGIVIAHETDPTKVIAKIKSQKSGEECHWIFDSLVAFKHLKTIKQYSSWEEYDLSQRLGFAENLEKMLFKYQYSKKEIDVKMAEFCSKYEVSYKSYFIQ